jgi:hypothetical protein
MYEDAMPEPTAKEPKLPLAMTWGIDNPLLNMAAFMGVSMGAKYLSGQSVSIPFLGKFGGRQALARGIAAQRRNRAGAFVSGGGRKALKLYGDLSRKYGANRWMGRFQPQDIMSARKLQRFNRLPAVARRAVFYRQAAKKLGGAAAGRILGYRALSGMMSLANVSFFAYMGASALGAVGNMIANWTPGQAVNPRRQLETGGPIIDTPSAMTQRQRAIQAIHNTQLSTRAALGNEASFMHYE